MLVLFYQKYFRRLYREINYVIILYNENKMARNRIL